MPSVSSIRDMLLLRYPQFSSIDTARIDAFISDALLEVPYTSIGDRGDLAVMYRAGSLLVSSLITSADGSGGSVKRKKDKDIEIEYFGGTSGAQDFLNGLEREYQRIFQAVGNVRGFVLK